MFLRCRLRAALPGTEAPANITGMNPFTTLEDALKFLNQAPPTGDRLEIAMADGFTVDGKADKRIGKRTMGEVGLIMALLNLDFKQDSCNQHEGVTLYRFSRIRMSSSEEEPFPSDFKPQPVRLPNAIILSSLPPSEVATYFEQHPEAATDLISESANKRYSPTTCIAVKHSGFRVGWYSSAAGWQSVMNFVSRSDAATDYLLFSLGKGRWKGRGRTN
jgi:hypothetical protein